MCHAALGVNATVWCKAGNLYAANALKIFDSAPWQLPSDAYLATRSADWKLPTARLKFETLTGELSEILPCLPCPSSAMLALQLAS